MLNLSTRTSWVIIIAKQRVGEGVVVSVDCVLVMLASAKRNIIEARLLD